MSRASVVTYVTALIILTSSVSLFPFASVLRIRIRIRRIHMFLGLLDPNPDPLVTDTDPDPLIINQRKRKTLIYTVLWHLYDFLSLKNDVNVGTFKK
jgi:hypothetical protein